MEANTAINILRKNSEEKPGVKGFVLSISDLGEDK